MRVAALIVDLDGTLSDPVVGIGRSLNYALEAFVHSAALSWCADSAGDPLEHDAAD